MHMEKSQALLKASRIFIDADAFVATINAKDSNHQKAITISKYIKHRHVQAITSNFTIGEAITVISQKTGLEKAISFGRKIYKGEILIIDAARNTQLEALEKFSLVKSKNVRFTDFVNMALMEELKITTIFSFDKHYKQAGFTLLNL